MNTLTKLTLTALTIATLAGCAAPLPKGSDTSKYLPTPVDVSKMKPVEMTLKAKNGDEYDALRFHDVAANKWFDSDGYPVNEKFLRVLKTGEVCEGSAVRMMVSNPVFKNQKDETPEIVCWEDRNTQKGNKFAAGMAGVALVVAPVATAISLGGTFAGEGVKAAVGAESAFTPVNDQIESK